MFEEKMEEINKPILRKIETETLKKNFEDEIKEYISLF